MSSRLESVRRTALFAVVPLTLFGSSALVWQSSRAAFTATTGNPSNSWTSGTVALANDQSGVAVFDALTGLVPDSSRSALSPPAAGAYAAGSTSSGGSACIKVTYSGSVTANVRLRATLGGAGLSTLGGKILLTVDMVNAGLADAANPSCSAFPAGSAAVYGAAGTTTHFIKDFPTTYGEAKGVATNWAATPNTARWYRVSWLLPSTVNSTATTAESVTATFTWEAISS